MDWILISILIFSRSYNFSVLCFTFIYVAFFCKMEKKVAIVLFSGIFVPCLAKHFLWKKIHNFAEQKIGFEQLNNDCMYLYLNSDLLLSNKLNHPFYFRGTFVRFRRIVQWIYTNFNKGAEVNASNPKRNVVHFRIITKWIVRWGLYDMNTSSSSNSWGCKPQKTSIIIIKMVHMYTLKQWERIDTLTYKEMMYLCYATSNR